LALKITGRKWIGGTGPAYDEIGLEKGTEDNWQKIIGDKGPATIFPFGVLGHRCFVNHGIQELNTYLRVYLDFSLVLIAVIPQGAFTV